MLKLCHLLPAIPEINDIHIDVIPGMRANLMARQVHPFDHSWPWGRRVIDISAAIVVAVDEEGSFRTITV
jgi:hypothetical protein